MSALLEIDAVSVAFGGLQALTDVTLQVPDNSIVGLIGPNGAGKTTLFNVVSGLERASSGIVRFDGRDVTTLGPSRRAVLGIGRSLQNLGLIGDETVLTNIMAAQYLDAQYHGWDILARPWRWWAAEKRLRERAKGVASTLGLDSQLDMRVSDLPFAGARFTELACVFVEEPRLMLLDEPTTGLDRHEIDRLLEVIQQRRVKGAVLLVAHDIRFVMSVCDHVYVLSEGRVLFEGPPNEVQAHPQVIEAYLGRSA